MKLATAEDSTFFKKKKRVHQRDLNHSFQRRHCLMRFSLNIPSLIDLAKRNQNKKRKTRDWMGLQKSRITVLTNKAIPR